MSQMSKCLFLCLATFYTGNASGYILNSKISKGENLVDFLKIREVKSTFVNLIKLIFLVKFSKISSSNFRKYMGSGNFKKVAIIDLSTKKPNIIVFRLAR